MRSLFAGLALLVASCSAAPAADLISELPGAPKTNFQMYSGYLNATEEKSLFYWFAESANDPSKDPVVLWVNGGPGCSSLDGLLYEHGPLLINDDGATLRRNPESWNNVANMLYIESPACVGLSIDRSGACKNTDNGTATDAYVALREFFEVKFPEFAGRDFYVSGESYGGIYVPMITKAVLDGNAAGNPVINIRGFLVGNGITSFAINDNSLVYYAYYHMLVGDDVWQVLMSQCNGSFSNPPNQACSDAVNKVMTAVYSSNINFYGIYYDCYHPTDAEQAFGVTPDPRIQRSRDLLFRSVRGVAGEPYDFATAGKHLLGENVPCINSTGATTYLNRADVRRAIHADPSAQTWSICSDTLHYKTTVPDIRPIWVHNVEVGGLRFLNYVGDTDFACNALGNQWAVDSLGYAPKGARRTWSLNNQVAGFVQEHDKGVVYATVRGAGHMVPQFKREQALHMFANFIADKPL